MPKVSASNIGPTPGENFKEIQMAMIIDGLNKCVIAKDTVIVDGFADLYKSL